MPLTFRLYQKKRGHRRTGSQTLGSLGEALFFGVFLAMGCGFLILIFYNYVIAEWRVNHEFLPNACKVLDKRIAERIDENGPTYRAEIKIDHQVNGIPYKDIWAYSIDNLSEVYSSGKEDKQAILDRFAVGSEAPCWYDPLDPERVVLVRGLSWWIYLVATVPVIFIIVGAGGIVYTILHWGKSAEHRAAIARRVKNHNVLAGNGRGDKKFPNVPAREDITNSPGTRLCYRLPIETSPGWAMIGTLIACVCWNGIVGVMVFFAFRSFWTGNPEWFLTIFCIPFIAIGLFLIYWFFRQVLVTTTVGPTLLEISDHPLHPGKSYKVFLSQTSSLDVKLLKLLLVCEEEATYRQGTDTRTESQTVFSEELVRAEILELSHIFPMEMECELRVPPSAMHSFQSAHNRVNWTLVVEGSVSNGPDFHRAFPVIVYPNSGGDKP